MNRTLTVRCEGARSKAARGDHGFSLVELLIVVAIVLVICSASLMAINSVLKSSRADYALQIALGQIRQVHQRAIDERRVYRLTFSTPGNIRTDRMDFSGGVWTPSFIDSINLPTDMQFTVVSGTPTTTTPNGFGSASNAIDLSVNNTSGATQMLFQADGRVLDSVNRVANGIVYLARPADLASSRAVTIFGSTGRVKGWKLFTSGSNKYWGQP
ncbi:MAG TPA: type II secretion system protein [Terriglobales bacterium]|nr:type II secretion system protein [Terriglobales bacterium]